MQLFSDYKTSSMFSFSGGLPILSKLSNSSAYMISFTYSYAIPQLSRLMAVALSQIAPPPPPSAASSPSVSGEDWLLFPCHVRDQFSVLLINNLHFSCRYFVIYSRAQNFSDLCLAHQHIPSLLLPYLVFNALLSFKGHRSFVPGRPVYPTFILLSLQVGFYISTTISPYTLALFKNTFPFII